MAREAMLMVLWEPPATLMEEFNAWYDEEHLPERAAIDGFRTARRYVSTGDGPPHMAAYDLSSLAVLDSPAYQAVAGENFTPWSRRIMARAGPQRLGGTLHTGSAEPTAECARLLVLKFSTTGEADVDRLAGALPGILDGKPGLTRWRLYSGSVPAEDFALVVAEFSGNAVPEIDAAAAGLPMTLAAGYRTYRY